MTTIINPTVTREQKINFVMVHRHGAGGSLMRTLAGIHRRPGSGSGEKPSARLLEAEQALMALSEDELDAEYIRARSEAAKELVARAEREERDRPFNNPEASADFVYWAKIPYWTIWEAVALLMGKNPKRVTWESVRPYLQISPFAKEFERIAELAHRAAKWNQLTDPVAPGAFIAWAQRYEMEVPPELEAGVRKFGRYVGDWKTLYDSVVKQRDEALNRVKELNRGLEDSTKEAGRMVSQMNVLSATVEQLRAVPTPQPAVRPPKPADPREIDTLRKMLIVMAVKGYSYNPDEARSSTIAEIVNDAEHLGLSINRDTVRKHLKAALDLLPRGSNSDGGR